jgi:hypothetical protein
MAPKNDHNEHKIDLDLDKSLRCAEEGEGDRGSWNAVDHEADAYFVGL